MYQPKSEWVLEEHIDLFVSCDNSKIQKAGVRFSQQEFSSQTKPEAKVVSKNIMRRKKKDVVTPVFLKGNGYLHKFISISI